MHTEDSLVEDLSKLGVQSGVLLVHSGYRALGDVEGGPEAVARALVRAVGPLGTLLAPAFTTNLVDPYAWPEPPPPKERARIMAEMPVFELATSVPHKMGAIAVAIWRLPEALRSRHPVTSWVAVGRESEAFTRDHPLEDPEGIDGPLGRALRAEAKVLLLGVGHDANTTIHLAESLLDMPHLYALPDRYPVDHLGGRTWRSVTKTTKCSDGFVRLTPHFAESSVDYGRVGDALAMLLSSQEIVRVAQELLRHEPTALLCDDPTCVHCPTSRSLLMAPPESHLGVDR